MFDPYHKWLSIPPKEQPPNHYRLLGIELFESDAEVIDNVASKQMAHVKTFATGPNLAQAQKLLNEIAAARRCLLDPKKKAAYDAQLRARTTAAIQPGPAPQPRPERLAPILGESAALISPATRRPQKRRSPALIAALVIVPVVIVAAILVPMSMRPPRDSDSSRGKNEGNKDANPITTATSTKKPQEPGEKSPPDDKTDKRPAEPTASGKSVTPKDGPPPPTKVTVTLEIDPPLAQVFVDERFIELSPGAVLPFNMEVEAGKHDLKVVKEGFQDYAQALDAGSAALKLTIRLTPSPPPEPKVAARSPVPEDAAQKKALMLIHELFKGDYAKAKLPSAKQALAQKLLQQGLDAKDDPAGRYMLYCEARDLAAAAGAYGTVLDVMEQLAQAYEVDALDLKTEALVQASKATAAAPVTKAQAASVLAVLNEAIMADDYAAAARLGPVAIGAARSANDSGVFKSATLRAKELEEIKKGYDAVKSARDILEEKSDDPEANLAVGRHACFLKGAWEQGLPQLSLGKDAVLRALADKELAGPTEAADRLALGDGWWDVAQKENGLAKAVIARHAQSWYEQSTAGLTGLAKAKVEQRLAEIAKWTESTSLAGQGTVAPPPRPSVTVVRPKHIPKDALRWEGNWYWFSDDKATFTEAAQHAAQLKGRLVTILTDKENTWVSGQIRGATFLGMRKVKGVWLNSLGARQAYFNWEREKGQPSSSPGETFAAIHRNGRWHDYLSDRLYYCVKWAK